MPLRPACSIVVVLALCVCLTACTEEKGYSGYAQLEDSVQYSFFVAGHVYGNPVGYYPGLHKPLLENIPFFDEEENLEFGVFTGDVVPKPIPEYFDSAIVSMSKFPVPIKIAPGNHDRSAIFKSHWPEYFVEEIHGDLHIYLAPTEWQVKNQQLKFFHDQIARADSFENVFIFVHELLWWSPDNRFSGVDINWTPHYNANCNFWSELHPALDSLENDVYLMAGDLGASKNVTPFMFHREDNITFIGSGMGGKVMDNFIIVDVMDDQTVHFRHFTFNMDSVHQLPDLSSYELPLPVEN